MIEWRTGINKFNRHILDGTSFTTIMEESSFEPNRTVDEIFLDHIRECSGTAELLYSGGADSELVLASFVRNNVPVEAMTMVIKVRGAILNVVDLYYSEKFCREHNIKQNLFYLDATEFYESGNYLEYLLPFKIIEPHVASHFWLIEKCHNYPIVGGDWPWVQVHRTPMTVSPFKLGFCSYERFMTSKGISGIGNMISHSFESCYHFMYRHVHEFKTGNDSFHTIPFLKQGMYELTEPRIKSYGWENCPLQLFNINLYRKELISRVGNTTSKIVWGDKVKQLLNTTETENDKFI